MLKANPANTWLLAWDPADWKCGWASSSGLEPAPARML